ncbi:MAG TPA: 16S rRNA (cytidine(1402)-2'-O)-methyltransferase [Bacillota bacterium]|nr:MAG: Ribosomal RNA small subunit methyltransferase I [Firmicutes bacterium ADurb.Bin153]HNV34864.1 16S rRNA (cytidine(1402)-2'-O)-methyltransferase [Bacillota bacterium]
MGKGRLVIVATPIGNMGDITARALEALGSCDIVASEDTRKTGIFLKRLGISRPQMSFHSFNEEAAGQRIASEVESGKTVALVSDAGTPGISDPGFSIVRSLAEKGLEVTMAPGPTAFVMALVLSGLPCTSFTFRGFPPRSSSKRRRFFEQDRESPHTLVYYESPHRLVESLSQLMEVMGDRQAALCNDLTKMYEKVLRGPISRLLEELAGENACLGEYVIVMEGIGKSEERKPKGNKFKPEGDDHGK